MSALTPPPNNAEDTPVTQPSKRASSKKRVAQPSTASPADEVDLLNQLREENAALKKQLQVLTKKNAALQKSFEQQQSATNDLNLLKNAMIHNVSHELKTPLLHVKAAVANLAEQVGNSSLIDYATTATTRLEGIIRNISLLASSLEIKAAPASLRDSIDQALRSLRRSWEHKDQVERIKIVTEDALPPVMIDAQAIGIVLQLLIDNALKFSREDVHVYAKQSDNGVIVEIADRGIGIPDASLSKIFDAFYQVDSSSTRRFSGTGVGLAIVRLILENHNILIEVESTQGKGSSFKFLLPHADL